MSELMNAVSERKDIRLVLLSGVSALALSVVLVTAGEAQSQEDGEHPQVWIELGGQLEKLGADQTSYSPLFASQIDPSVFTSPASIQRTARYASGFEGSLLFEPSGTDWKFAAALRFGRSNAKHSYHKTKPVPSAYLIFKNYYSGTSRTGTAPPNANPVSDNAFQAHSSYTIADFSAGRDVGIGMLGRNSSSVVSAGVRFAQFTSKSSTDIRLIPNADWYYIIRSIPGYFYAKQPKQAWNIFDGHEEESRSFSGVGPSLSWTVSQPLAGREESLALDWGVNGSVLFGRQRVDVSRETSQSHDRAYGAAPNAPAPVPVYSTTRLPVRRNRSVVVPNVGGFAGLSLRFPNARIRIGYRADFFFGAMDGGIDTRKTYDRDFYGPFATISIGLGG